MLPAMPCGRCSIGLAGPLTRGGLVAVVGAAAARGVRLETGDEASEDHAPVSRPLRAAHAVSCKWQMASKESVRADLENETC